MKRITGASLRVKESNTREERTVRGAIMEVSFTRDKQKKEFRKKGDDKIRILKK